MKSKRKTTKISGEIELQFALVDPIDHLATPDNIFAKFQAMTALSPFADDECDDLEKVESGDVLEDDEDKIEDAEATSDEAEDSSKPESVEKKKRRLRLAKLKRKKKARAYEFMGGSDVVGITFLEIGKITDLPPEHNGTVPRSSYTS